MPALIAVVSVSCHTPMGHLNPNTTAQISLLLHPTQAATNALRVCLCACSYAHINRDLTHSTGCQRLPHFLCHIRPPVTNIRSLESVQVEQHQSRKMEHKREDVRETSLHVSTINFFFLTKQPSGGGGGRVRDSLMFVILSLKDQKDPEVSLALPVCLSYLTLEHKRSTAASKVRKEGLEEGVRLLKCGLHLFPYVCMGVWVGR